MTRRKTRTAFLIHEALMALALSLAVIAAIAQLLVIVANQRRVARQQSAAAAEAGNLMERLIARPWEETTAERLRAIELSEECRRCLPDARLHLDVADEDDATRRVSLRIDWSRPSSGGGSMRLVAWKHRIEEGNR
jgi:hypothetical protein